MTPDSPDTPPGPSSGAASESAAFERPLSRRRLLGAAAAGAGSLVLSSSQLARAATTTHARTGATALPRPDASGIEHVVVLMMENRSFDHYLGWLPGADGRQAGLSYKDSKGVSHPTHHLTVFQGCENNDPDHSYAGGRIQFNRGACDGFLADTANDPFAIGYYKGSDLSFYGHAAPYWTVCDHYFAATMGPTYPNRLYMHSAQTDRIDNTTTISKMPTIWDRLAARGVSHTYYFSDLPITALWGTKHLTISQPYAAFLLDCALGQLPAVSFLDPRFEDEGTGTSGDDHPHADIRVGQAFINEVYRAITHSPLWSKTVFVITYDEWGGFFDHVPPAVAPDTSPKTALRGFRVPAIVISPLAHRRTVAHNVYDHASVLKMIEWRWGLEPLTPRDRAARNLAEVLNFGRPNLEAPQWTTPTALPEPCQVTNVLGPLPTLPELPITAGFASDHQLQWRDLRRAAAAHGFKTY